jgi:hypothetical protein
VKRPEGSRWLWWWAPITLRYTPIKAKEVDSGLVTALVAELAEAIDHDGHIPAYAVFFDTGFSKARKRRVDLVER